MPAKKTTDYIYLVKAAIVSLKESNGSSLQAIKKFVAAKKGKGFVNATFLRALSSAVTDSDLVQVDGLYKLPPRRGRMPSKHPPLHDALKHARAQYKMNASGKNRKSFVAAIKKYHHRFTGSNSERIFSQLVRNDAPKSAAQIEKSKKNSAKHNPSTNAKWNAENNAKNNPENNKKAKEKREAALQTALLLHTNEGIGLTVAEARVEAKRLLETHLAALPNVVEKICVGMKNFDSDRRRQHYPRKKGWEATGAKSCTYDPITAYHTYNQLSCRRMEHAIMKELEKYHVLHNKNGGGGGPLGIRNGSGAKTVRMADGKPQWLSDPKGYVVYLVFVPAC
jgi:histone H1/5